MRQLGLGLLGIVALPVMAVLAPLGAAVGGLYAFFDRESEDRWALLIVGVLYTIAGLYLLNFAIEAVAGR